MDPADHKVVLGHRGAILVLGTAGHIDHGKTALIRALTGVETDRLAEEQARGITISLGFAPLDLDDGRRVSVVDVPGHEGLVRTMVSGATGIDLVLLVVAADEGVMPQTREHVAICELLGIDRGIVALTKIDSTDADLAALARDEVSAFLSETSLAAAPVVPVSSLTGEGIAELRRDQRRDRRRQTSHAADGPTATQYRPQFFGQGFWLRGDRNPRRRFVFGRRYRRDPTIRSALPHPRLAESRRFGRELSARTALRGQSPGRRARRSCARPGGLGTGALGADRQCGCRGRVASGRDAGRRSGGDRISDRNREAPRAARTDRR